MLTISKLKIGMLVSIISLALIITGCSDQTSVATSAAFDATDYSPSLSTQKANQAVYQKRPFENKADFENAWRGLIAQESSLIVTNESGEIIWNMDDYAFVNKDGENAPASVNPSLWRQAALNNIHGLFKVTDKIYQLRGFDLANMSIIETDTGWLLVDPLTSR